MSGGMSPMEMAGEGADPADMIVSNDSRLSPLKDGGTPQTILF